MSTTTIPKYQPPSTLLNHLPPSLRPYAEICRLHKPTGILIFAYNLLLPALLTASLLTPSRGTEGTSPPPPFTLLKTSTLLILAATLHRSAFCAWNDILDADLDARVARTRLRPLPRGAITAPGAFGLVVLLLGASVWVVNGLLGVGVMTTLPFLGLHTIYPCMKRVTNFPQLWLGAAFAGGVGVGYAVLMRGQAAWVLPDVTSRDGLCLLSMGVAIAFWNALVDTIYSGQDLQDDKKAGIKSILVVFESSSRGLMRALAVVQVGALVAIGHFERGDLAAGGSPYFGITCGATAVALGVMVERVDLRDAACCAWWFTTGNGYVAACMGGGLLLEYYLKL